MGWAVRDVIRFGTVKLDQAQVRTFPVDGVFRLQNAYLRIHAVVVHAKCLIDFIVHEIAGALGVIVFPRLVRGNDVQWLVDGQLFRGVKHAVRAVHRLDEKVIDEGLFSGMQFFRRDLYHLPCSAVNFLNDIGHMGRLVIV